MIVLPGVQVPAIYKDTSISTEMAHHDITDTHFDALTSFAQLLFTYYFTHLGILNGSLQVSPIIQTLPVFCTGHRV